MSDTQNNQQKILELSELAGGLAHEIRNPLSTLKVNMQLLSEDLREEPSNRIDPDFRRRALQRLDSLRTEAERLQNLLDDFLRLVGQHDLKTKPIDVNNVVQHLIEFFTPQAQQQRIELRASLSNEKLLCELDDALLKQALLNLFLNAQDAMPDGGELFVTTRLDGRWVHIDIIDNGVGIEASVLDRVFLPFFSTKNQGSGLGLTLTRRIINDHGGTIAVQSESGKGTRFSVRIPVVQEQRPASAYDGDSR